MNKEQSLPILTDKLTQLKRYYIKNQSLFKKLGFDLTPFIATIKEADALLKQQQPTQTQANTQPGIIKVDNAIGEQSDAPSVHTFSKGDLIEITTQTRVEFGVPQTLVEAAPHGQTVQYWVSTEEIGLLPQKITEIPESEREKVVIRFTEMDFNLYTDMNKYPKTAPTTCKLTFHFSAVPSGLQPMLKNVVYGAIEQIDKSANADKLDSYSAINIPLALGTDIQLQADYGLDPATAMQFANQKRGFRFTFFPLDVVLTGSSPDNHDQKKQTDLFVLVEDLGTIELKIPTALDAATKQIVEGKIKNKNIQIDATNMTADEVECLKGVLSVLPKSVWDNMSNMKFKVDDAMLPAKETGGMYNMGDNNGLTAHTIYLRKGVLSKKSIYLGDDDADTTELARFISSAQYVALHELGHVVDFSPVQKSYNDYTRMYWIQYHPDPKKRRPLTAQETQDWNAAIQYFTGGKYTYSGHKGYVIDTATNGLKQSGPIQTTFSRVIKNDNSAKKQGDAPNSLTAYGDTAIEEAFAESFAIYVGAPHLMEALSPDVFAYFKKLFP